MKSTKEENEPTTEEFKHHASSPGDISTLWSPSVMELMESFPFKEGQIIESKSKVKGYRGAWFRSEIRYIKVRNNEIWCAVQYIDFPDEKINYTKAYQQPNSRRRKRVLMFRPAYPLLCMGLTNDAISAAPGPVIVVNGDWLVGDLVDWFSDGCFWAAKITAVKSKDFVQVELPSAPLGEGGSYEAAVKDIRPSLDWSEDHLWTLPSLMSRGGSKRKFLESEQTSNNSAQEPQAQDKEHFLILKQEHAMLPIKDGTHVLTSHNRVEKERKPRVSVLVASSHGKSKVSDTRKLKRCNKTNHYRNIPGVGNCTSSNITLNLQENSYHMGGSTDLASQVERRGIHEQDGHLKENMHILQTGDLRDLSQPLLNISSNDVGISKVSKVEPLDIPDETLGGLPFEDICTLVGEGKFLDLDDQRISSSIMALEELMSKVIWMREVLQLGLKGWRTERKKRKWVVCENDVNHVKNSD